MSPILHLNRNNHLVRELTKAEKTMPNEHIIIALAFECKRAIFLKNETSKHI